MPLAFLLFDLLLCTVLRSPVLDMLATAQLLFALFFFCAVNAAASINPDLAAALNALRTQSPGMLLDLDRSVTCVAGSSALSAPDESKMTFVPVDLPCGAALPNNASLINTVASVTCLANGSSIINPCDSNGQQLPTVQNITSEQLNCGTSTSTLFKSYRSQCRGMMVLDASTASDCSPTYTQPKTSSFIRASDFEYYNSGYGCYQQLGPVPTVVACTYANGIQVFYCDNNKLKQFVLPPTNNTNLSSSAACGVVVPPYPNFYNTNNFGFTYRSMCGPAVSTVENSVRALQIRAMSTVPITKIKPASSSADFATEVNRAIHVAGTGVSPNVVINMAWQFNFQTFKLDFVITPNMTGNFNVSQNLWAIWNDFQTMSFQGANAAMNRLLNASQYMASPTPGLLNPAEAIEISDPMYVCLYRSPLLNSFYQSGGTYTMAPSPDLCAPPPPPTPPPPPVTPTLSYAMQMPGLYVVDTVTPPYSQGMCATPLNLSTMTFIPSGIACNQPYPTIVPGQLAPTVDYFGFSYQAGGRPKGKKCADPWASEGFIGSGTSDCFTDNIGSYHLQAYGVTILNSTASQCPATSNLGAVVNGFAPQGNFHCAFFPTASKTTCLVQNIALVSSCSPASALNRIMLLPSAATSNCTTDPSVPQLAFKNTCYGGSSYSPSTGAFSADAVRMTLRFNLDMAASANVFEQLKSAWTSYGNRLSVISLSVTTTPKQALAVVQMIGLDAVPPSIMSLLNTFLIDAANPQSSLNVKLRAIVSTPLSSSVLLDSGFPDVSLQTGAVCNFTNPAFQFTTSSFYCPATPTTAPTSAPSTPAPTGGPNSTVAPTAAPTAKPTVAPTQAPAQVTYTRTSVKLNTDLTTALTQSFQQRFIQSVASSLRIDQTRISIANVYSGSAIIVVSIASPPVGANTSSNNATVLQLASQLNAMSANSSSTFARAMVQATNVTVDSTYVPPPPAVYYQCPDGSVQISCPSSSGSAAPSSSSGLGIGVGAGAAIIVLVFAVILYRRWRAGSPPKSDGKQLVDEFTGAGGMDMTPITPSAPTLPPTIHSFAQHAQPQPSAFYQPQSFEQFQQFSATPAPPSY